MKKKGANTFTVIVSILVIACLAVYVVISNQTKQTTSGDDASEVEKLLSYDFEEDYPKTVKETVRLHCRYMKCAYNNEFAEDELSQMNKQVRNLYDQELLDYNEEDAQLDALKQDIQYYVDNKQKIVSYSYGEDSQIEYNTEDQIDYAKIRVTVLLRVDSAPGEAEEEYILRKNDQGQWKILGWQAVNKNSNDKGDAE